MPKYILLADDSVTIQKVVELTFSDGDYHVTCVSNGKLALQKIQEHRPDILLCDVIMPELNGYEVCSAVKHTPDLAGIPVILMTGTFEPFDEDKARHAGADTFVTKPFESKLLVEKVEELLKKRMVLDTTLPQENAQIFQSREEFTLQAPVPSDEEFLAAQGAGKKIEEAVESPFLPAGDDLPQVPVQVDVAPPPAPFVPPSTPEPTPGGIEEVFASPPSIAPPAFVPPPTWEPPAPERGIPPPFQPVPEAPSPAESLFDDAPPAPALEGLPQFVASPEPELPPFDALAPESPLEVVHDMMDQEDMVAHAQVPILDPTPVAPPFEGPDEAPPLEMPYESVAPKPSPEVSTVEFPGAPEPSEEEAPLTSMAFDAPEPPAVPPPDDLTAARGDWRGESAFEASPVEVYPPGEERFIEPHADSLALEAPSPVPEAMEAPPPPREAAADDSPPPFSAEGPFGTPLPEEGPSAAFEEPPTPVWEPPAAEVQPEFHAEEAFAPAPEVEAAVEPPPPQLPPTPAWEPPVAEAQPEFHAEEAFAPAPEVEAAVEPPPPQLPPTPTWEPPAPEAKTEFPAEEAFAPAPEAEAAVELPTPVWEPPVAEAQPEFHAEEAFGSAPKAETAVEPPPPQEPPTPVWEPPAPEAQPEFHAEEAFAPAPEAGESVFASGSSAAALFSQEAFPPEPEATSGPSEEFSVPEAEEPAPEPPQPPPPLFIPATDQGIAPLAAPAVSAEDLEAAVRKVIAEMAPEIILQVAWEVIPELAESLIKRRIRELESTEE